MNWFNKVKKYYDKGIYSIEDVRVFVLSKKITAEDFKKITGQEFE